MESDRRRQRRSESTEYEVSEYGVRDMERLAGDGTLTSWSARSFAARPCYRAASRAPGRPWARPVGRAERINRLLAEWRTAAGAARTQTALRMIDLLGTNPFLTPRGAEARPGLAYNTVMRAIGHLQAQGVLTSVGGAERDRAVAPPRCWIYWRNLRLTPM